MPRLKLAWNARSAPAAPLSMNQHPGPGISAPHRPGRPARDPAPPNTLIMYWLDGRTLMHAVADAYDYEPGTPVDADPAEDVEAYLVACDAEEFMRSGMTTWPAESEK